MLRRLQEFFCCIDEPVVPFYKSSSMIDGFLKAADKDPNDHDRDMSREDKALEKFKSKEDKASEKFEKDLEKYKPNTSYKKESYCGCFFGSTKTDKLSNAKYRESVLNNVTDELTFGELPPEYQEMSDFGAYGELKL